MSPLLRDCIVLVELVCWPICFWWMHRMSSRQNAMLRQLRQQGHRIENVSKEEHEILKELHPAVQKIEETIADSKTATK
jgi:hypothetical protein